MISKYIFKQITTRNTSSIVQTKKKYKEFLFYFILLLGISSSLESVSSILSLVLSIVLYWAYILLYTTSSKDPEKKK